MRVENVSREATTFTANAFLIDDVALVDAGADDVVLDRLVDMSLDTVVITHSHHDHVENLPAIVERHEVMVYASQPANLPVESEPLDDGDTVELAGHRFQVLHTPGHKDDHVCLYDEAERVLFSGDLIFPGGSFGRTDLAEGDRDVLIRSIERIAALDVQALYPGHDTPTTENVNQQISASLERAKKREPKYD